MDRDSKLVYGGTVRPSIPVHLDSIYAEARLTFSLELIPMTPFDIVKAFLTAPTPVEFERFCHPDGVYTQFLPEEQYPKPAWQFHRSIGYNQLYSAKHIPRNSGNIEMKNISIGHYYGGVQLLLDVCSGDRNEVFTLWRDQNYPDCGRWYVSKFSPAQN